MRRNTLLKLTALLMAASCLMTGIALAAVPETAQPLSSSYFDLYDTTLSPLGGGKIRIEFDMYTSSTMDKLGVDSIVLYESSNRTNWKQVKTYDGSVYLGMIGTDTFEHSGSVSYYGAAGCYYKAYVCVYAKKGTGSESNYIWTEVVRAT